jgi:uncharacterized membrane protein
MLNLYIKRLMGNFAVVLLPILSVIFIIIANYFVRFPIFQSVRLSGVVVCGILLGIVGFILGNVNESSDRTEMITVFLTFLIAFSIMLRSMYVNNYFK